QKTAALDREVWAEFESDPERIDHEATIALNKLGIGQPDEVLEPELATLEGRERETIARVRINQRFFRDMILASYGEACSVCGLPLRQLLVAAHIVPWAIAHELRMNPRNGLYLCGTHDLAFERGLLRVAPDYRIQLVVPSVGAGHRTVNEWLTRYD